MDSVSTNNSQSTDMDIVKDTEDPATTPDDATSISPYPPSSPYTVGYAYSTEMMQHYDPKGHPEAPERISRIWKAFVERSYNLHMKSLPVRPVKRDEALLVHSEGHWDKVLAIQHMTPQEIADSSMYYDQLSLYVMQGTTRAARLSCGGVIEACLAVGRGELKKTFAIVRPPGHHAEPDEHMGFCFFNNVAVATRVVQQSTTIKKILILDWDVHHGNGTQRAFYDDPSVLYISLHRYENAEFYPSSTFGSYMSCGEGAGLGYSVNIPWPEAGMRDADYIHAFQKIVMPIATEFAPELVIISAGFDAAAGDQLGECFVSPVGYAHMTHMLSSLAGGRMVVALEGGYNLDSITVSAVAVASVLLGEPPEQLPPMVAGEAATETVWLVAQQQSKYWKNVDPKACEIREGLEPISFSIPEILKAHRQYYLYKEHNMMQVPMLTDELEARYSSQVMCTPDLFERGTLIVLAHEFGNLRFELESSASCNVQLERSYLIDFSRELIKWVKDEGYSLLDVNLFPRPFASVSNRKKVNTDDLGKDVMSYLWDNYIQLSNAQQIVLIGHGPGCQPLMELLETRTASVMRSVKAVVQIVGLAKVPMVPRRSEDLREWYMQHSLVVLPETHRILGPEKKPSNLRKHGNLVPLDEAQPVRLVMRALPGIKDFVKEGLEKIAPNGTVQNALS